MSATLGPWLSALAPPAAVMLLSYAALHDLAVRTIPNTIPTALAVLGLALHLLGGDLAPVLLTATAVTLCVAFIWTNGWLGGGDFKLLVALTLLLPPTRVLPAIVAIAWSGAALALPYLALRNRIATSAADRPAGLLARIWRAERFRLHRGGPLPYGMAIAAGGIVELLRP